MSTGQPFIASLVLIACVLVSSSPGFAEGLHVPAAPTEDRFKNEAFRRAARLVQAGNHREAAKVLLPRIKEIRASLRAAYHGKTNRKRRHALDAFVSNPHPVVVLVDDRFWLRGDVLRLAACVHAANGHWDKASNSLLALIQSKQATANDLEFARTAIKHTPKHPLHLEPTLLTR